MNEMHGAKLEHLEQFSAASYPRVAIEDRAPGVAPNPHRDGKEERTQYDQPGDGSGDVDCPFDHQLSS